VVIACYVTWCVLLKAAVIDGYNDVVGLGVEESGEREICAT
jgi:hypothetical protein